MDEDYLNELREQADFWGMDSLTENQQALVDGYITMEEYDALEND